MISAAILVAWLRSRDNSAGDVLKQIEDSCGGGRSRVGALCKIGNVVIRRIWTRIVAWI